VHFYTYIDFEYFNTLAIQLAIHTRKISNSNDIVYIQEKYQIATISLEHGHLYFDDLPIVHANFVARMLFHISTRFACIETLSQRWSIWCILFQGREANLHGTYTRYGQCTVPQMFKLLQMRLIFFDLMKWFITNRKYAFFCVF